MGMRETCPHRCLIFIAAMALSCFMVAIIALLLFIKGSTLFNLAAFYERSEVSPETEESLGAVQETAEPFGDVQEGEDLQETVREAEGVQETVREKDDLMETEKLDENSTTTRESMKTHSQSPYVIMVPVQDPGPVRVPPGYAVPRNAKPVNPFPEPSAYLCMRTLDGESKDRGVCLPPRQTYPTEFGDWETAAFSSGHYLSMDPLQEAGSREKL